jgi:hypothetical protein
VAREATTFHRSEHDAARRQRAADFLLPQRINIDIVRIAPWWWWEGATLALL